jgi:predicted lipid-binding transport protein (Tim44 family)
MKTLISAFVVVVMAMGANFTVGIDDAEAKRFGGGKSFGGKSLFSKPQKRSAPKEAPRSNNAGATQGAPAGGAAAAGGAKAAAAGGAAKTGMMGMLGGLMIGGLLGAMFFGGAFENINFMDILIIGLIAFLAFKFFASRRRAASQEAPVAAGYGRVETPVEEPAQHQQRTAHNEQPQKQGGGFNTDLMFGGNKPVMASGGVETPVINKPKGFEESHFISGAQSLFTMMQKAWDDGELGEIRQFTTDHVFAEIQDQYRAREADTHNEVISAHAELYDARDTGSALEASALFTVTMKEDGEEVHVQEIWHFTKPHSAITPTWYLDGIQQLED